ncbi:MAG: OmpA family protein [Chryseosolibacter sp.]
MMQVSGKGKQLWVAGLMILIFSAAQAQSLKEHLAKGDRYYQRKDYKNAIADYLEALKFDDADAQTNYKVGIAYLHEEHVAQAVAFLEKAYNLNPAVDQNIDYHLGMAYQGTQQYAKAREHFTTLKAKNKSLGAIASRKIRECALADSLMNISSDATITALAHPINTPFSELLPLISNDGQTLIFTSNRSADDYQIKSATNFEDVYISQKEGTQWGPPARIGAEINVKLNEAALSLSADGKTLFLHYEEGRGDIYTSTLENGSWARPVPLNRFINHPEYSEGSACVSADGKRLYFSSNRAGGRGGYDIYVSQLGPNGQWGRAANLGSTINTRGDEVTPFLHVDGITLFFSSNGHATLGSTDVFKSRLQDGKWSKAAHLGTPINTSGPDQYFVLSADARIGYYARLNGDSPGNIDLYSISFNSQHPSATPEQEIKDTAKETESPEHNDRKGVAVMKGSVVDARSLQPLQSTLRVVENATNKVIMTVATTPSGTFELHIPDKGNYGVTTETEGYLFNSMNFDLPAYEKYREIETRILMVKATVGSKVVLKNIFFDVNQSELISASKGELETIRDLLLQNPGWRIQINGHTDNVGNPKANMDLSLKRAEAVVQYLIRQGIDRGRLQAKGFGSEQPLVSNDDEAEGRQINRRTEIEIIR